jgi:hypothetical protein
VTGVGVSTAGAAVSVFSFSVASFCFKLSKEKISPVSM